MAFISECYANAIPPQGQSALAVATLRPSIPPILCWKSSSGCFEVVAPQDPSSFIAESGDRVEAAIPQYTGM